MGHLENEHFAAILARCAERPAVYIETGLWKGEQLRTASRHFEVCHGIELDDHWYGVASERVAQLGHVNVHRGDTRDWLPRLLARYADVPCFVKLDAHYCKLNPPIQRSPFPLWFELTLMRDRRPSDVVSVDDTGTFGVARPELRYERNVPEWEHVTVESIREFMGERFGPYEEICKGLIMWLQESST